MHLQNVSTADIKHLSSHLWVAILNTIHLYFIYL